MGLWPTHGDEKLTAGFPVIPNGLRATFEEVLLTPIYRLRVIWNVVPAIRRSRFGVNPWFWTAIRGLTFIPNEVIEQESDG
jgi:polyisoprenoid-binding protein YceI